MAWVSCGGAPAKPAEPLENTAPAATDTQPENKYDGDPSKGALAFKCDFENGWVAMVPEELIGDPMDEFLMQALIGLTAEPDFWTTLDEYKQYAPHAAVQCTGETTVKEFEPGNYVMLVGWAGQFEKTGYKNNGRIEKITITAGEKQERSITTADLDKDLPCVSCPFLLVMQDGEFVELGQILIDRYVATKQGTDARETRAQVTGGLITIMLEEREPEVSYIDSVEVFYNGKPLPPAGTVAPALRAQDGAYHTMATGDSVTVQFQAPIAAGTLPIEVRVNGYYILDRAR